MQLCANLHNVIFLLRIIFLLAEDSRLLVGRLSKRIRNKHKCFEHLQHAYGYSKRIQLRANVHLNVLFAVKTQARSFRIESRDGIHI